MALKILERDALLDQLLASYTPTPVVPPVYPLPPDGPYDCQACGACCIEAGTVPVYPEEDQVPAEHLGAYTRRLDADKPPGMRQITKHLGGRCKALTGEIGACVGCSIYANRPKVCATFPAGSNGCKDARLRASQKMLKPEAGYRGYGAEWQTTVE